MEERDSGLSPFAALIGTWVTEATHPRFDVVAPGRETFEWLAGGRFLIQRSHHDHEAFPNSISIIGRPEAGDGLVQEYFDSRGVRRTYGISFDGGVLRLWRDEPGIDQRFAATPGPDTFGQVSSACTWRATPRSPSVPPRSRRCATTTPTPSPKTSAHAPPSSDTS